VQVVVAVVVVVAVLAVVVIHFVELNTIMSSTALGLCRWAGVKICKGV